MKNFIATHEFKSTELQEQYFQAFSEMSEADIAAAVHGEKAVCQMNWANGTSSMRMFCWWKAVDADAIIEQLGDMNNFFDTVCEEMDSVVDFR
ncbi:MAG: hypothetical protein CMM58_02860 [Rhodospirillaceae bacterium]|nr:hypothetical protein [Rhodospirillaceae bacterium]|tara:strand:+ start:1004 stop:1282 length:279 start_codon:yes stop_codon:yes gene_type:complete